MLPILNSYFCPKFKVGSWLIFDMCPSRERIWSGIRLSGLKCNVRQIQNKNLFHFHFIKNLNSIFPDPFTHPQNYFAAVLPSHFP